MSESTDQECSFGQIAFETMERLCEYRTPWPSLSVAEKTNWNMSAYSVLLQWTQNKLPSCEQSKASSILHEQMAEHYWERKERLRRYGVK